jgi:hypothetical protein
MPCQVKETGERESEGAIQRQKKEGIREEKRMKETLLSFFFSFSRRLLSKAKILLMLDLRYLSINKKIYS